VLLTTDVEDVTPVRTPHIERSFMTAPALVVLSPNPEDARGARVAIELCAQIRTIRPDIDAQPAFLHDAQTVIDHLADAGHTEIVVVPALLAGESPDVVSDAVDTGRSSGPTIAVTEPLGLDSSLLRVLDQRMREALSRQRIRELDALVLAGTGSSNSAINSALARAARIWGKRHHLPTIAAFGTHVPPAVSEAVRSHRIDGRRHIAVGRLFLSPGSLSDRVGELAIEAGAVAVSQPLGAHEEIAQLALTRYGVGSLQLLPLDFAAL